MATYNVQIEDSAGNKYYPKPDLLTTKEQLSANTAAGKSVDALVVKEINNNLNASSKFPDGAGFYPDVKDGIRGYNTNAARGADTFHPFSSDLKLLLPLTMTSDKAVTNSDGISATMTSSGNSADHTDRRDYHLYAGGNWYPKGLGSAAAWSQLTFSKAVSIKYFFFYNTNSVTSSKTIELQYSDNGTAWTTVATDNMSQTSYSGHKNFRLLKSNHSGAHKYWRVYMPVGFQIGDARLYSW